MSEQSIRHAMSAATPEVPGEDALAAEQAAGAKAAKAQGETSAADSVADETAVDGDPATEAAVEADAKTDAKTDGEQDDEDADPETSADAGPADTEGTELVPTAAHREVTIRPQAGTDLALYEPAPPHIPWTRVQASLPTDSRAGWIDSLGWAWWLVFFTIVRTLMSTSHIIYPRLIGIGILCALVLQAVAHQTVRDYWPWASLRSMRAIAIAGLGFAAGICFMSALVSVQLVPWSAAVAAALVEIGCQYLWRLGWAHLARRTALKELHLS